MTVNQLVTDQLRDKKLDFGHNSPAYGMFLNRFSQGKGALDISFKYLVNLEPYRWDTDKFCVSSIGGSVRIEAFTTAISKLRTEAVHRATLRDSSRLLIRIRDLIMIDSRVYVHHEGQTFRLAGSVKYAQLRVSDAEYKAIRKQVKNLI